ncbi:hypothetical protein HHI36_000427, partial [Cryptolaemus montrouzieri]
MYDGVLRLQLPEKVSLLVRTENSDGLKIELYVACTLVGQFMRTMGLESTKDLKASEHTLRGAGVCGQKRSQLARSNVGTRDNNRPTWLARQLLCSVVHSVGLYGAPLLAKAMSVETSGSRTVPPSRIHIYDDRRIEKTILLGPYNEGSDLNLICEVKGGRPRPRVNWFLENSLLDDTFEIRSDGITVNYLTFRHIERKHLHARFICQASNNNLVAPETRVAVLDINLKPQTVSIVTKERQVSAEKRYEVECRTSGSRPDAVVTWWRGSRPVKRLAKIVTSQNNHTVSTLTFVPVIEDDGKYLTCRAENPSIPDSALEDRWRLNVHYVPVVTLKMGSTLNPGDIKEGDDVYFECNIRANPKVYKLSWFHN